MNTARRVRISTALAAATALTLLALAGCSGGGDSSSTSAGGGAQTDSGAPGRAGGGSGGSGGSGESAVDEQGKPGADQQGKPVTSTVDPAALQPGGEMLARRANVALRVKSISAAVASIRATSAAAGGLILSENIGSASDIVPLEDRSKVTASTYGEITISVPADRLDRVIGDLGKLGTLIRSGISSENVKAQVVDTESRVKTMRASVDRVRALMSQTKDITQIVALESELSRRQADLEALESQLASLKGSVARSPIQISLTTEPDVIAEDAGTGFLAGLEAGWKAFTDSVVVVLTVLGALLPFAFALALVAIPLWLLLRRRRAGTPPPPVLPQ